MTEDPAILAFEALRKEVSLLSSRLERLPAKVREVAPDYAPTFAEIMLRIERLHESCLVLAPEAWISALGGSIADLTKRTIANELTPLALEHRRYVEDMGKLTGGLRALRATRRILIGTFLGGAATGIALWLALSGPVARSLPAGLQLPERMAAATLAMDRWNAGARLMAMANPAAWAKIRVSDELIWSNRLRLAACLPPGKVDQPVQCAIDIPSSVALRQNLGLPSQPIGKARRGKRW